MVDFPPAGTSPEPEVQSEKGDEALHQQTETTAREHGWSLLELMIGLALIVTILLGITASISTSFAAGHATRLREDGQRVLKRLMEEVHAVPFGGLLSLNGGFVVDNDQRADFTVQTVQAGLVQIQLDVHALADPDIKTRATVLRADY